MKLWKDTGSFSSIVWTAIIIIFSQGSASASGLPGLRNDADIKNYQKLVQANPQNIAYLNGLASAYIQKVRETADQSYNVLAEKLLTQALALQGNNYDSLVYLGLVQMSQHRFTESRLTAQRAIAVNPETATAYGILGDASYELGSYEDCAEAYQKLNDLKPGMAAYSRAANYRRLVGDLVGAMELMTQAIKSTNDRDAESRAWSFFQVGNYAFAAGKLEDAEMSYALALKSFPNHFNALAGMAKVKAAKNETKEAISLYQKALSIIPLPEFAASLGDLYLSLGRKAEAEKQFELVEYIGLLSKANREMYNRQLAVFYADHDRKLEEALALAQAEIEIRKDIYGYDALAWCLYKNGKYPEALEAIKQALRMGTQDAMLLFHAGMIYEKLNQPLEAKQFLLSAQKQNEHFHPVFSKEAQEVLHRIDTRTMAKS